MGAHFAHCGPDSAQAAMLAAMDVERLSHVTNDSKAAMRSWTIGSRFQPHGLPGVMSEKTMEKTTMLGADEVCHLISNWTSWNSQPRPMVEASEHGVYFERPKASRRPRYSDRWQNSGGKKGSCDVATTKQVGSVVGVRRRYGTVQLKRRPGQRRHYYEYTLLRAAGMAATIEEDKTCTLFHVLPGQRSVATARASPTLGSPTTQLSFAAGSIRPVLDDHSDLEDGSESDSGSVAPVQSAACSDPGSPRAMDALDLLSFVASGGKTLIH